MIALSVEVKGVRQTVANLNRLNVAARQRVREQVARTALAVERGAKRLAPVDTGRLRSSIHAEYYSGGLSAEIGPSVHYAPYVEYGTRPHFPPPSALRGWCRRVLKNEKLAFVVARKIAEKGTEAKPFLEPAWNAEKGNFEKGIADAVRTAIRQSSGSA